MDYRGIGAEVVFCVLLGMMLLLHHINHKPVELSVSYNSHRGSCGYIYYPQLIGEFSDLAEIKIVNQMLQERSRSKNRFGWIPPQEYQKLYLNIHCEVTLLSDQVISSHYSGYSHYTALSHPSAQSYGVTIDFINGEEIPLKKLFDLSYYFWEIVESKGVFTLGRGRSWEERTEEDLKAHFRVSTREEMLALIKRVSRFPQGSYDYYLTEQGLVVIIPTIYVIGDYVEVFIAKKDIRPFLKIEERASNTRFIW